jgi:hypothetical protein
VLAVQLAFVRSAQGRLAEPLAPFDVMRETLVRIPAWRAWLACRLALLGELDEAALVLAPLAGQGLASIPRDQGWFMTLANAGRAAVLLDDLDTAKRIYEMLTPYENRHMVAGLAVAYGGPVSFHLGTLAGALGDLTAAQHHLTVAITAASDLHSPPWEARGSVALAGVLLRTGHSVSRPRALELLEEGLATARRLGLAEITGAGVCPPRER